MTLDYSISSLGSCSSVDVGFFVQSHSGKYIQLGSRTITSTGSYTFQVHNFNYIGVWDHFTIALKYYGSGGWNYERNAGNSFIVYEKTAYPYDYPNPYYVGGIVRPIYYNSKSVVIADLFGSVYSPNAITTGSTVRYSLTSGIAPKNNSYEVNQVGLFLNYTDNSLGQTPSDLKQIPNKGLQQYVYESSYQNYQNSSFWPLLTKVLWVAAFAAASAATDGDASVLFAAGGALNPFLFLNPTTQNTPSCIPMNLAWTQNGGLLIIPERHYSDYSFSPLGTSHSGSFKPSYIFNIGDSLTFNNPICSDKTPYVVDYMQYTMTYSIFNVNNDFSRYTPPTLYSGSYSVSLFLPEYVPQTS